jgi:hypothetical protein
MVTGNCACERFRDFPERLQPGLAIDETARTDLFRPLQGRMQ